MTRAWRVLVLGAVIGGVGIGGITCGTPKPAEEAAIHLTSAAPETSAAPSASPVPSAEVAPPAKLPIRESTPGRVQCETVDCDLATEVCCVAAKPAGGSVGRCVAKPAAGSDGASPCCPRESSGYCGNSEMTIERRCDEAPDCPGGQRCCAGYAGEGDLLREECEDRCFSERCLASSTCPNGNRCGAESGEIAGECPLQIKPPKCGAATCKTGEMCCWEPGTARPRCAESCDADVDMVFACTAPEQCAPYDCNSYAGMPLPKYTCGGSGFMGSILCQTLKDCPKELSSLGTGPTAPKARACVHTPDLPPGVKACDYQ